MGAARRHRVTDSRDDLSIQVHSDLDDYGLDPFAYRVYGRMARRAGDGGVHWESVRKTAEACRMSARRVHEALRLLEAQGLIHRVEGHEPGETVEYRMTPRRDWAPPLTSARGADPSASPAHPSAPHADPPAPGAHPPSARGADPSASGADEVKTLRPNPDQDLQPNPPTPQKAKGKKPAKEPEHEFDPATVELPPQFDQELFADFCQARLEKGFPMTLKALKLFVDKHKKHTKAVLDDAFRSAIINGGWRDLYPKPAELARGKTRQTPEERGAEGASGLLEHMVATGRVPS